MPITINIPPSLQQITETQAQVVISDAETLLEALHKLCLLYPEIRSILFKTGLKKTQQLNVYLRISIDEIFIIDLTTKINQNCNIVIITAIAGG